MILIDLQHADILSDLAAALAGSIGIAPTSNLDPTRENPSMFEPIHGSAFDITGLGIGERYRLELYERSLIFTQPILLQLSGRHAKCLHGSVSRKQQINYWISSKVSVKQAS